MIQTSLTGPNPVIARGDKVVPLGRGDLLRQREIERRIRERHG